MGTDEVLLRRITVLFSDRVHGEEFKLAYKPYGNASMEMKLDHKGKM